jgi:hypothetical protein
MIPDTFGGFDLEQVRKQTEEAIARGKKLEAERKEAERRRLEDLARGNAGKGNVTAPDDIICGLDFVPVIGAFDECIDQLAAKNARIISCEQLAAARIYDAAAIGDWKKSDICLNSCWVGENFNYMPDGNIIVAKTSCNPILHNLYDATNCHRRGQEFYLNESAFEELQDLAEPNIDDAIASGVLLLNRNDDIESNVIKSIHTSNPGDNKLGIFLFGTQLKPYCSLCKDAGTSEIKFYTVDEGEWAFARLLQAHGINSKSEDHVGAYPGLHSNLGRVYGIRSKGGAQ